VAATHRTEWPHHGNTKEREYSDMGAPVSTASFAGDFIKSVSRPPSVVWCLNDKMIKELMTFAKCETEKCLINYIEIIRY
jgi:hypothetical protein